MASKRKRKTPDHGFDAIRGSEIKEYINDSSDRITKFVILDDDDDMDELLPFLVETSWDSGLDEKAKELAIHLLNG